MKNINGFLYNCAHINKNNFSNIKSKSKRDFIEEFIDFSKTKKKIKSYIL